MSAKEYYKAKLNEERIQTYHKLAEEYNPKLIEESVVRDIFCKGAEWGFEKGSHSTIEDVKGKENELLNEYSKFLEENGYLDTDWWQEEPFAIDEFKKSDQYKEWCSIREKLKI